MKSITKTIDNKISFILMLDRDRKYIRDYPVPVIGDEDRVCGGHS